jgi:hypothetical protein
MHLKRRWLWPIPIIGLSLIAGLKYQSQIRFELLKLNPDLFLSMDCNVIDWSGQVLRSFAYSYCEYLNDGRLIAANDDKIMAFDKDMRPLWEKTLPVHHRLNKTRDGRHIVFLSSETQPFQGEPLRFDVVYKMDLDGNIVNSWRVFTNIDELKRRVGLRHITPWRDVWTDFKSAAKGEISHANSVYEIGDNPYFKPGDFIVNLHGPLNRIIVLSHDLSQIDWLSKQHYHVHDVQVTDQGNILLYRNFQEDQSEVSTLEEIDPRTEQPAWIYKAPAAHGFFSKIKGSVQRLRGDFYLFADLTTHPSAVLIDKHGQRLWSFESPFKNRKNIPIKMERVQLLNLRGFLKMNNL